jgi:hypothetical protein
MLCLRFVGMAGKHKALILAEFPCQRLTDGRFFAMRFHIAKMPFLA